MDNKIKILFWSGVGGVVLSLGLGLFTGYRDAQVKEEQKLPATEIPVPAE